jgi:hypothetical protein
MVLSTGRIIKQSPPSVLGQDRPYKVPYKRILEGIFREDAADRVCPHDRIIIVRTYDLKNGAVALGVDLERDFHLSVVFGDNQTGREVVGKFEAVPVDAVPQDFATLGKGREKIEVDANTFEHLFDGQIKHRFVFSSASMPYSYKAFKVVITGFE